MFRIEMLPAAHGDALLVEYGDTTPPSRILIDAGTPGAYKAVKKRLLNLQAAEGRLEFELLVITHVDDDHIGGVLALLEKKEIDIKFRDIWFNGFGHLLEIQSFGPVQGERLTTALIADQLPWNLMVEKKSLRVNDAEDLPALNLPGGMKLTLLSPDTDKLERLAVKWEQVVKDEGLVPNVETDSGADALDDPDIEPFGPIDVDSLVHEEFHEDKAEANGSSIAFLAEFGGKRVLFAADAHPGRLIESIDKLVGAGNKLALDACKLSHHGSNHNTSPDLIDRLECKRYLISTSGAKFKHPHRAAVARLLRHGTPGKQIAFNYRSDFTSIWDDPTLQADENYSTLYPPDGSEGVTIDVG